MLQRPGSSWGFGALLKDTSVVVLKEGTPTIPAGPEIRTHNLPVISPTRYPLGHDCPQKPPEAWPDVPSSTHAHYQPQPPGLYPKGSPPGVLALARTLKNMGIRQSPDEG